MIPTPTIIRSPKRKRSVALHVEEDGSLTVMAPMRTSLGWIQAFIQEKAGWIARRQKAVRERASRPALVLGEGSCVPFMGQDFTLCLHKTQRNDPPSCCPDYQNKRFDLFLSSLDDPKLVHDEIVTELTLWYRRQARPLFTQRLAFWSERMNLTASKMVLTAPRKRWGSCNSRGEIRLNWRLILAAPDLIDYLIVHELAHIPHKNHGKRFQLLVLSILPDMKKLEQRLRIFEKSQILSLFRQ